MPKPSNLTETDLKEILVTWYLASEIAEHHVVTLAQNDAFAECDFQIISALDNFHQSFWRYFRQANFTRVIGQACEVLAEFDDAEIVCLQNIRSKKVDELNSKTIAIENDIFFKFTFLTRWDADPEPAVLRLMVAIQDEEAVPLVHLPRRQGLYNQCLGRHHIRLGKHAQVPFKINTNVIHSKGSHIDNLKIKQNLLLTSIKIIAEVNLQHVWDTCDEHALLQFDVLL